MLLKGKAAIVTGAAQGIGKGIATLFAENGANVILCDVKDDEAKKAAGEITEKTGFKAVSVHCDITKKQDIDNAVKFAMDQFGKIDILVNNAGILILGKLLDYKEEAWDKMMAVNVKGAFLFSQAVGRIMKEQRSGKIIITSSCCAKKPLEDHVAYCTSKSALTGLTRMIAFELGEYGVTCNAICPTVTDTELVRNAYMDTPEVVNRIKNRNVLKRLGQVQDMANVVLMLASDYTNFITGESIIISGGDLMGQ